MIIDARKDDFVIDFNNQLVDLSNLISTRVRRRSTLKQPPMHSPKRPPRRRLYPLVPTEDSIEKEQLTREMEQLAIDHSFFLPNRKHTLREANMLQNVPLLQEEYSHHPTPLQQRMAKEEQKASEGWGGEHHLQIEVYPGIVSPLRGARETKRAILMRSFRDTSCFECAAKIRCIQDAEYVLCPKCKVISPLWTENGYGVGLGLVLD